MSPIPIGTRVTVKDATFGGQSLAGEVVGQAPNAALVQLDDGLADMWQGQYLDRLWYYESELEVL